ncbi:MAG: hypothetical protein AB9866_14895 [Syntrophobacteraceae bacterium]
MRSSRGESRKTCIYLIKQHTCATNKEIAESFGTLSYSAVAKISQSVSKKMGVDKELRERVKRLQAKYSLFKAWRLSFLGFVTPGKHSFGGRVGLSACCSDCGKPRCWLDIEFLRQSRSGPSSGQAH